MPDRWQRLNEIFHATLSVDADRRAAFVAEACAGDEALRREIEALLRADEQAGRFLTEDALHHVQPETAPAVGPGRRVGPYRIVEAIGLGGMGAVFLAERTDGHFEQRVAIKVI